MMLAFPLGRLQRLLPLPVPCQGLRGYRRRAGLPPRLALREPSRQLLRPCLVMPQRGDLLQHGGEPAVGRAARRLELPGMALALGLERCRETGDLTLERLRG